jgi:hypothetical protein
MSRVTDDNVSYSNNAYYMHDDAYDRFYASYTYVYDYYNHYSYKYNSASWA